MMISSAIKRIKEIAQKNAGETVLLTFYPHPRMVLFPEDKSLRLLNTQEEKIELLFELADVYDDYEEFDKVFDHHSFLINGSRHLKPQAFH